MNTYEKTKAIATAKAILLDDRPELIASWINGNTTHVTRELSEELQRYIAPLQTEPLEVSDVANMIDGLTEEEKFDAIVKAEEQYQY